MYILIVHKHVCAHHMCLSTVQVSEEGDRRRDITLETVIQVLEYVLKEELLVLWSGEELTQPSIDLLAAIFNYCKE